MANNSSIIYILANLAMPGYLKIGHVGKSSKQALLDRLSSAYGTSVPRPWRCEYAAVVVDAKAYEQQILCHFSDYRPREDREFLLDASLAVIVEFVRTHARPISEIELTGEDYTSIASGDGSRKPRDENYHHNASWMKGVDRGKGFRLADDSSTIFHLSGEKCLLFRGQVWSLSRLARKFGRPNNYLYAFEAYDPVEGWETLAERKKREQKSC